MFDFFYWGRILAVIEQHPREIIGAVAATYTVTHLYDKHVELKKATLQAESDERIAELKFNTARLELEIAQLKSRV